MWSPARIRTCSASSRSMRVDVLVDGVGGALVPRLVDPLLRRQHLDRFAEFACSGSSSPARMCRSRLRDLNCVTTRMRRRPLLMQLESVKSMMRYSPPNGHGGLGPVAGERFQPRSLAARQNHSQDTPHETPRFPMVPPLCARRGTRGRSGDRTCERRGDALGRVTRSADLRRRPAPSKPGRIAPPSAPGRTARRRRARPASPMRPRPPGIEQAPRRVGRQRRPVADGHQEARHPVVHDLGQTRPSPSPRPASPRPWPPVPVDSHPGAWSPSTAVARCTAAARSASAERSGSGSRRTPGPGRTVPAPSPRLRRRR